MDKIELIGKIVFSPDNKTKKHSKQSTWKKVAMIMFEGDVSEYYAWYIKKRFNLPLNKPLRGAHISFINDDINKMTSNGKISVFEAETRWNETKRKWDGKRISIMVSVSPKFNNKHWWLDVDSNQSKILDDIRNEVGLGKPYFHYHMSLGYANEKYLHHHLYITNCITKGLIN